MFKTAGVVGAGTMGHGIAMQFAMNGMQTWVYDISEKALQEARRKIDRHVQLFEEEGYNSKIHLSHIDRYLHFTTDLSDLSEVDFVTECVKEDLATKHQVFKQLDEICKEEAILVSNTSSLRLSDIFKVLKKHRERSMLTHWFNPPHIVPLVELLKSEDTADETYVEVKNFLESVGKVTIEVKKETPGLVANRIQIAMAREVLTLLEEGVADERDLDLAITSGPGFRLSSSGLLEIIDFGGIDVWQKVMEELQPVIASGVKAFTTMTDKVENGDYGVKTGKGFYEYPGKSFDAYLLERDRKLLRHLMKVKLGK